MKITATLIALIAATPALAHYEGAMSAAHPIPTVFALGAIALAAFVGLRIVAK
jgi:hypothetical protein